MRHLCLQIGALDSSIYSKLPPPHLFVPKSFLSGALTTISQHECWKAVIYLSAPIYGLQLVIEI